MRRIKPEVDVILSVLEAVLTARPDSPFVQSLLQQYRDRGSLSKKQLEGLRAKADKIKSVAPAKLATLDAIILRMHTKHKSAKPAATPLYEKDETAGMQIGQLLTKFPAHKRVLFFKNKYDNNEPLSPAELSELERFCKLLLR